MAKDPGFAVVLSLLTPGLGQVYNEQFIKAVVVFIVFLFSAMMIGAGIGILLLPIVYILAAWDAYRSAK